MFLKMFEYMLMFLGKKFLKIDKWFPLSKTFSKYRNIKENLKLSDESMNVNAAESNLTGITMQH